MRLEAWWEDHHAGSFIFDRAEVRFEYAEDAPAIPLSLSMPREGHIARNAPLRFLQNLLPEHDQTRAAMADHHHAASAGIFDLLSAVGEDLPGGLTLLPEGKTPDPLALMELDPALDRDIAGRIRQLKRNPSNWTPSGHGGRFSLAGTQGKFAMALLYSEWYWSNATVPSTHIVKPGRSDLPSVEEAEVAALNLARDVGVPAPAAEILRVEDQTAFMIERFDRAERSPFIPHRRLHAEDLAQAMGRDPKTKYGVTAQQVIEFLAPHDPDETIRWAFVRQLIFNTLIGNSDAHAKNYSLLLRPEGIALAPLYDAVPVGLHPQFNQELAMDISGAKRPQAVNLAHWRKLARRSGLDEDHLAEEVERMAGAVLEHPEGAWDTLPAPASVRLAEQVTRNAEASRKSF